MSRSTALKVGMGLQGPTGTGTPGPQGIAGPPGTVPPRAAVVYTSPDTIANGANYYLSGGVVQRANLGKSFALVYITASCPCRVRLYATAAAQVADLFRSAGIQPTAGTPHGVILDIVLSGVYYLGFVLSPEAYGANAESPAVSNVPITLTNLSGSTQAITVTFTAKVEEA